MSLVVAGTAPPGVPAQPRGTARMAPRQLAGVAGTPLGSRMAGMLVGRAGRCEHRVVPATGAGTRPGSLHHLAGGLDQTILDAPSVGKSGFSVSSRSGEICSGEM